MDAQGDARGACFAVRVRSTISACIIGMVRSGSMYRTPNTSSTVTRQWTTVIQELRSWQAMPVLFLYDLFLMA